MSQDDTGRVRQKQRTRDALLLSARTLLESGQHPGLKEVADHAGISRATAYRYYSSTDALLSEAVLDGIASRLGTQSPVGDHAPQAALSERIDRVVDDVLAMVLQNETLFRAYLRDVAVRDGNTGRGARRLRWLTEACGDDRARLPRPVADRMLAALALVTGIEGVIVAKDVCGLDDAQTRDLFRWTAKAIVTAALAESAPTAAHLGAP